MNEESHKTIRGEKNNVSLSCCIYLVQVVWSLTIYNTRKIE